MFDYKSLIGKASGLNWYMLAAKVAIVALVLFGTYSCGKHNAELKCEQAKTELAQKELSEFSDVIGTAVTTQTEAAVQEGNAAQEDSVVIGITEAELQAEIAKVRTKQQSCNLSDLEYRKFNELARKTRGVGK